MAFDLLFGNIFCMYFGRSFFEYLENTFVFQIAEAAEVAEAAKAAFTTWITLCIFFMISFRNIKVNEMICGWTSINPLGIGEISSRNSTPENSGNLWKPWEPYVPVIT